MKRHLNVKTSVIPGDDIKPISRITNVFPPDITLNSLI